MLDDSLDSLLDAVPEIDPMDSVGAPTFQRLSDLDSTPAPLTPVGNSAGAAVVGLAPQRYVTGGAAGVEEFRAIERERRAQRIVTITFE
jgi:hypothetical protein